MLANSSRQDLFNMIENDEGFRQFPYKDTKGFLTIGFGRNLDKRGVKREEAFYFLENDVNDVEREFSALFPPYKDLCDTRKIVLLSMGYNMGVPRLMGFKKMLKAIELGDFHQAAIEALDSKWHKDVGARAERLAYLLEFGKPLGK